MHVQSPQPIPSNATDLPFPGYAPLDIEHDHFADSAFPTALGWSADDLVEAVRLPPHQQVFAPSANDAQLHRPRRRLQFLATPSMPPRFRIGG